MTESKEVATVEPSESTNLMQQMIAAAPHIDVDKLEKLMGLNQILIADQRRASYAKDFAVMKPNLPRVIRTKTNEQTKSKYAPLEDINKVIDPILAQYGFGTSFKIIAQTETGVTGESELWHREGHVERSGPLTLPIDNKGMAGAVNKTVNHGISATVTYLKRITLCSLLELSTGDDTDGNTPNDLITEELAADINKRIDALPDGKEYRPKLLSYLKVEDINQIRATAYMTAINALKAKEKGEKKPKGEAK